MSARCITFSEDFRESACICFVRHFVEKYASKYASNSGLEKNKAEPVLNDIDATSPRHDVSGDDVGKVTRDATAAKAVLR